VNRVETLAAAIRAETNYGERKAGSLAVTLDADAAAEEVAAARRPAGEFTQDPAVPQGVMRSFGIEVQ
jgi:hypothetical protein